MDQIRQRRIDPDGLEALYEEEHDPEILLEAILRSTVCFPFTWHPNGSEKEDELALSRKFIPHLANTANMSVDELECDPDVRRLVGEVSQVERMPKHDMTPYEEVDRTISVLLLYFDWILELTESPRSAVRLLTWRLGKELPDHPLCFWILALWAGGPDADGNDKAIAEVFAYSCRELTRRLFTERFIPWLQRVDPVSDAMAERLAHNCARLQDTIDGGANAFASAEEFRTELLDMYQSGQGGLERTILGVEVGGFHMAQVQPRQHADVNTETVRATLNRWRDGEGDRYVSLIEAEREAYLLDLVQRDDFSEIQDAAAALPAEPEGPASSPWQTIARAQVALNRKHRFGPRSVGPDIISGFETFLHFVERIFVLRSAGWTESDVPFICPLHESPVSQAAAPAVTRRIWAEGLKGWYGIPMGGYSDPAKLAGTVACRVSLYLFWEEMTRVFIELGEERGFFHGPGPSPERGGDELSQILALPPGTVFGDLRGLYPYTRTVQRLAFERMFGVRELGQQALGRDLAAIIRQTMVSIRMRRAGHDFSKSSLSAEWRTLAAGTAADYVGLMRAPRCFDEFVPQLIPFEEVIRPFSARNSARAGSRAGIWSLDKIRMILLSFGWAAGPRISPIAYHGFGKRWRQLHADEQRENIRRYYAQREPFTRAIVKIIETSLSAGECSIAHMMCSLFVDEDLSKLFMRPILEGFDEAATAVLEIRGGKEIGDDRPWYPRYVANRNVYAAILHAVVARAVRVLRDPAVTDARERERELERAIKAFHGIALLIRSHG